MPCLMRRAAHYEGIRAALAYFKQHVPEAMCAHSNVLAPFDLSVRFRAALVAGCYNVRPALSAAPFSCVSTQKSALQALLLICKAFFTEINLCKELENVSCEHVKFMHSK
jgi:hypothetical protein